jgi:phage shock protein E
VVLSIRTKIIGACTNIKNKIKKIIPFVVAATAILLFSACTQNDTTGSSTKKADAGQTTAAPVYKKITPVEAKTLIDAGNVIILDVRTQEEFDLGHIKDAVLLPNTDIAAKAAAVLPDKSAKILVYCRSGNRSGTASKELIAMGYTDVLDFGGINDWPYDTVK